MKNRLQHKKALFLVVLVSMGIFGLTAIPNQASVNAVVLTCDNAVRIGIQLQCKATGLTVGTDYVGTAVHSAGNITYWVSASSTTEYFFFTMTSADTDGAVTIAVATSSTTTAADTTTVNLIDPASDIPSAFFQQLLAPILIIGIFVLLMSAFFIYRGRRK